ncbi:MAG: ParB/RepB/Spo0J family partition protein [Actinobacteria bacterium]|nr:ParB/RepB/Spo0J family partition protein [Actinomycetota bacterium]
MKLVEIDRLVRASDNLRRQVGNVTELAASMRSIGVLEPLFVTPWLEGFVVVAGHRRLAAARKAGLEVVPCVVREMSAMERVIAMVVENEQRTDLSPVEAAEGYFRLIDLGMTQRELARRVGRTAKHVASRLALLELPRSTSSRAGPPRRVRPGAAPALLELVDEPEVIEEIVSEQPDDIERAVIRHQSIVERAATRRRWTGHPTAPLDDATDRVGGGDHQDDLEETDVARRSRERRQAEVATRRAQGEARVRRAAFVGELLGRRLPKADVAAHVAFVLIDTVSTNRARLACRSLDVESVDGPFGPDWRTALAAFADGSVRDRDRAVLAICLAKGEESAGAGYPTSLGCAHVRFLADYGYEVGDGDPVEATEGDSDSDGLGRNHDAA